MKVLLTDDHHIVRDGLKQILAQISDIESIDEAKNGEETVLLVSEKSYDIVILDISLPDISGIDVLKKIKKEYPGVNVLMLSMHSQIHYALQALKMGASGYLTKDTASEELIDAVKKIADGGKYISPSLAEDIASRLDDNFQKQPHETLSEREFEIMLKIAKGLSLKEIGEELFISGKTVSTYRYRILEKMSIKKNAEITNYCLKNNLLQ